MKAENYIEEIFSFFHSKNSELNLDPDDNIMKTGIIDSFGLIELIELLENKYSIQFTDDDLTEERFKSIRSIAQLLLDKNVSES